MAHHTKNNKQAQYTKKHVQDKFGIGMELLSQHCVADTLILSWGKWGMWCVGNIVNNGEKQMVDKDVPEIVALGS
ncbi:unnamed protein product [Sphenostylis stenocarpa]|uniref:Uncharacterized protein n=1 Tax=Sphenostylis stenocarpa TaxID=92480 RepID=A0AA86RND0_9FABA|nr:unnamed protein product [Sphenostylis stenocarpa]